MHHLSQIQTAEVHGGTYLSSLTASFADGLDESERALFVTGLGAGFVGGAILGRVGLIIGAVTVGGYFAYDWFTSRSN